METAKKRKRALEISLLNTFLCILVVFIHVSSHPVSALAKDSWQYIAVLIPWRLSAFVVQGFVFLGGMKLFLSKPGGISCGKYYFERFCSVILPYIVWVVIYYIYFCENGYFPFRLPDLIRYVFVGNLVSPFYFIIIIAQFYILAPLWMRLPKNSGMAVVLPLSVMITVIFGQNLKDMAEIVFEGSDFRYTDRVFTTYLMYWAGGCYAGLYYEKFKDALRRNRILITVTFLILAAGNAFLSCLSFSGRRAVHWLENVHIMYCMSAILFFFMLSLYICAKEKPFVKRLAFGLDRMTYAIFLAHCLVIFNVNDALYRLGIASVGLGYLIRICVVYTVTIGGALIYYKAKDGLRSRLRFR